VMPTLDYQSPRPHARRPFRWWSIVIVAIAMIFAVGIVAYYTYLWLPSLAAT
jgi:hypothetical protein